MKRLLAIALTGATLLLAPASATGASGSDVAKGHGTTFFGDSFAFSATAAFNDTGARGSVQLDTANGATEETFYGDVTCLRVVGNMASIVGNITNVSPPAAVYSSFRSFIIQTSDGGKFGTTADTVTYGFSTSVAAPDGFCPTPTVGFPITTGDVVITDASS